MEEALADADADAGRQAEALRAHRARSGQLEAGLEQTRQACVERDRRIGYLETELDLARSDASSRLVALAALSAQIDELRVTARGQATRIRLSALRDAAGVSLELRALADAPSEQTDALLGSLERAIERIGSEWDGGEADAPAPASSGSAADRSVVVSAAAGSDVVGSELAELEAALDDPVVSELEAAEAAAGRSVSVDIGPFADFSQLVSFEDAANAITATSEISIRRFSEGRASIDVSLREPIDLLAELEARCDFQFAVRRSAGDELVLDLDE